MYNKGAYILVTNKSILKNQHYVQFIEFLINSCSSSKKNIQSSYLPRIDLEEICF